MTPAGARAAPVTARVVLLVGVAPQARAVGPATVRRAVPKALAIVANAIAHPRLAMRRGATDVGAARIVDPTASEPPETVIVGLMATALPEKAAAAPRPRLDLARVTGVPTAASGSTAGAGSVARTEAIVDPGRETVVPTAATEPRAVRVTVDRTPAVGTVRVGMMATDPEAVLVGTAGPPEGRSPAGTTALAAVRVDRTTTVVAALA